MARPPGEKKTANDRADIPEHIRSAAYFSQLEDDWRREKWRERRHISQTKLAEMISAHYPKSDQQPTIKNLRRPGKSVSVSGLNKWLNGINIPDNASIFAIAEFFGVDPLDAFEGFGRPIPPSFYLFYRLAQRTAVAEQWEDAEFILHWLEVTQTEEWEHPEENPRWMIPIALRELRATDITIHTKAKNIAYLAQVSQEPNVPRWES